MNREIDLFGALRGVPPMTDPSGRESVAKHVGPYGWRRESLAKHVGPYGWRGESVAKYVGPYGWTRGTPGASRKQSKLQAGSSLINSKTFGNKLPVRYQQVTHKMQRSYKEAKQQRSRKALQRTPQERRKKGRK